MKNIFFLVALTLIISCKQAGSNATPEITEAAKSEEYNDYVAAYKEYVSCVGSRPQLTNDLLSKKIDGAQFEILLEKNTATCALRRKLYLTYYDILKINFPDEAAALQLDTDLGQQ